MRGPEVYAAISAVAAELARSGIAKGQTNAQEHYQFRGIDDVCNKLAPVLAAHKLCILPRMLERVSTERISGQELLISVSVKAAFDLVSAEDGSTHVIESYGEALDSGDKATAKAMTSAFKYALLQAFCIPVIGTEEADARTYQLRKSDHAPEPVQGWDQWSADISEMIRICETGEALDRVQNSYRGLLRGAARERPDLYASIGDTIRERRLTISPPLRPAPVKKPNGRKRSAPSKASPAAGGAHA